jgi:hypothetical protein
MSSYPTPSRVTLRAGDRTHSALPLVLRGDEATLMVVDLPPDRRDVHLVLDWRCGGVTELDARIRDEKLSGHVVDLDLRAVDGDWKPFLDYLGAHAN